MQFQPLFARSRGCCRLVLSLSFFLLVPLLPVSGFHQFHSFPISGTATLYRLGLARLSVFFYCGRFHGRVLFLSGIAVFCARGLVCGVASRRAAPFAFPPVHSNPLFFFPFPFPPFLPLEQTFARRVGCKTFLSRCPCPLLEGGRGSTSFFTSMIFFPEDHFGSAPSSLRRAVLPSFPYTLHDSDATFSSFLLDPRGGDHPQTAGRVFQPLCLFLVRTPLDAPRVSQAGCLVFFILRFFYCAAITSCFRTPSVRIRLCSSY